MSCVLFLLDILYKITFFEKRSYNYADIKMVLPKFKVGNITDPVDNIKPDKKTSTEKTDGAVATVMALDRTIRSGNDASASAYDDRGILFI